ncbi:MAG TPA: HmuY family protein [Flavitalea sp.]|nr:HmuY family protein [Flavitalea sp.]
MRAFILMAISLLLISLVSCYKLEDLAPHFEDGRSVVVYDLPGDTLATDGWDDNYEEKDTYLRQRYYNSRWTDSIRFAPNYPGEVINSAEGVDISQGSSAGDEWKAEIRAKESAINWLIDAASHPAPVADNDAYFNTASSFHYIYRSNNWYQMEILGERGTAENDSIFVNWRGYVQDPPPNPEVGWAYRDNDNNRVYVYNGKAWELMVNDANYRNNNDFIQVEYSKSGKEAGIYSIFLFRFSDGKQIFIRDHADSVRYLKTDEWDIAFTGDMNSTVFLNNGRSKYGPATGSPVTISSLWPYDYGYDFMNEAPDDDFFDNKPADEMQIGYASEFGPGVNSWYEFGSTFIAKPFPYKGYYLRLEQKDGSFLYGKLQLISMYKGAPEVLTDRNWPSPYLTFRYFIQKDGSRNLRTRD